MRVRTFRFRTKRIDLEDENRKEYIAMFSLTKAVNKYFMDDLF